MAGYYYAVAALPSLFFDADPPISKTELFAFLERQLTDSDLTLLRAAELEEASVRAVTEPAREDEGSDTTENEDDGGDLSEASDDTESTGSPVISAFRSFDRALRNALVTLRTDETDKISRFSRAADPEYASRAEELAREAASASDPLEAERVLERARFEFLEALEVGHYFDFERIAIYYLKLQLITVRSARTDEAGREAFQSSYEAVLDRMGDIRSI